MSLNSERLFEIDDVIVDGYMNYIKEKIKSFELIKKIKEQTNISEKYKFNIMTKIHTQRINYKLINYLLSISTDEIKYTHHFEEEEDTLYRLYIDVYKKNVE